MPKVIPDKDAVMAWVGDKPIYADRIRRLADVAAKMQPQAWKPANVAAYKVISMR
jgi:hypothetical protein